jgi:hypothetical protein
MQIRQPNGAEALLVAGHNPSFPFIGRPVTFAVACFDCGLERGTLNLP